MHADQPLTLQELDELERLLESDDAPEECMDIAMLDGFLTGVIIGPNTLLPSQWLPRIWGETADDAAPFADDTRARRAFELIMRFYNDRVYDLEEDITEFEPLIYQGERDGETVPVIDEWCTGFIGAIELDPEGWQPLVETNPEAAGGLLTPMLLYGTEEGLDKLEREDPEAARHREIADAIGPCVIGIRDYWLPRRKAASTFRREAAKVGRNDPCPCGSGRKYKKCCGTTAATL
jgi:uncharacterized protein